LAVNCKEIQSDEGESDFLSVYRRTKRKVSGSEMQSSGMDERLTGFTEGNNQ